MFKINGVRFKNPSGFRIERYNVTESERLANGDMSMELIAKKRKFQFSYAAITATDFDNILDLIWEPSDVFFTLTYEEHGIEKTATVYPGAIPSDLYKANAEWVWQNVQFSLIEK